MAKYSSLLINQKIDVWACGIIMYILLAGEHPFLKKGDVRKSLMERLQNPENLA
jgi:serine/threonine protein kinase